MFFINFLKYRITIARVIKVIYRHEYQTELSEYIPNDPFSFSTTNYDRYSQGFRHDDCYREIVTHIFDYTLLVEFNHNKKQYQTIIELKNSLNFLNENSRIIIYYERKNPNNAYSI